MPSDPVFLTGGSGLIGSHVAERLRTQGAEVVALQRRGSDTRHLESIGCRVVVGDLTDSVESHTSQLAGCGSIVHAAALVYSGDSRPRMTAVNVAGTRRLAEAAVSVGVERFVHLSSVAAYGRVTGPVHESVSLKGELGRRDHYARSKRQGEEALRDVTRPGAMEVTILRPAVVFGERDRLFTLTLARLAQLPLIPMLGSGTSNLPVVYAGNVASAIDCALVSERTGTFNVAEDEPTTQTDLVLGLAHALGRRPAHIRLPGGLVRALAGCADALGLHPPGASELSLLRAARLWTLGNPYVTAGVREHLGWTPTVDLRTAVQRTAHWLVEAGHVAAGGPEQV